MKRAIVMALSVILALLVAAPMASGQQQGCFCRPQEGEKS